MGSTFKYRLCAENLRGKGRLKDVYGAYLSDIGTNLADSSQKMQGSHPFFGTQSCFPGEVMKMGDQTVEEVNKTRIRTLGIDANGILGDVFNGQVLHWRHFGFGRIHVQVEEVVKAD